MKRGRKQNNDLPPSRSRDIQRAFRARRAQYIADLEQRNIELENENGVLRAHLHDHGIDLPPGVSPTERLNEDALARSSTSQSSSRLHTASGSSSSATDYRQATPASAASSPSQKVDRQTPSTAAWPAFTSAFETEGRSPATELSPIVTSSKRSMQPLSPQWTDAGGSSRSTPLMTPHPLSSVPAQHEPSGPVALVVDSRSSRQHAIGVPAFQSPTIYPQSPSYAPGAINQYPFPQSPYSQAQHVRATEHSHRPGSTPHFYYTPSTPYPHSPHGEASPPLPSPSVAHFHSPQMQQRQPTASSYGMSLLPLASNQHPSGSTVPPISYSPALPPDTPPTTAGSGQPAHLYMSGPSQGSIRGRTDFVDAQGQPSSRGGEITTDDEMPTHIQPQSDSYQPY